MSDVIKVSGIKRIENALRRLQRDIKAKNQNLLERLAEIGVNVADIGFREADYDGDNDVTVNTKWISDTCIQVVASGKSVLFIEFGSGMMGYGHPKAQELGYGPGTWSDGDQGKGLWQKPPWIYKGVEGAKSSNYGGAVKGRTGVYWSYGNPPARAMYEAGKEMRERILDVVREVYGE